MNIYANTMNDYGGQHHSEFYRYTKKEIGVFGNILQIFNNKKIIMGGKS